MAINWLRLSTAERRSTWMLGIGVFAQGEALLFPEHNGPAPKMMTVHEIETFERLSREVNQKSSRQARG